MPYSKPFLRLVVSGALATEEQFSFGMAFIEALEPDPPAPSEVPAGVIAALEKYWDWGSTISNAASLDLVKLNLIGTDGRYVGDETVEYEWPDPQVGASPGINPPQIALAVTLETGARRGLAHAGRFFLPSPAVSVIPSTGKIGTVQAGGFVTSTTTLLNELNAALQPWQLGVVSKVGGGAQRRVTNIKIGTVLDTIRSRRSSLDENYQVGPALDPPA